MFLLEMFFKVALAFGTYIFNTNKRIILIEDSKTKTNTIIPFSKIDSLSFGDDWIQLNTVTSQIKMQNMRPNEVIQLNKEINDGLESHKTLDINITRITEKDISEKIAKLKVLFDEGILTEYEFAMKKMELLDKAK